MSQVSDDIDRIAVDWAARISGGPLTPEDEAKFAAWHEADVRHRGAFVRAEAVLLRLDRFRVIGAEALRAQIIKYTPSVPRESLEDQSSVPVFANSLVAVGAPFWTRRRVLMTGSMAACVAGAGIVASSLVRQSLPENYSTDVGETRVVSLQDGSVLTLNTNSKVSVQFTETERGVVLDRGEGLFHVAKDKTRPFIVRAFDTEIRAVGTVFTVRFLPERPIQVLVEEGVVEVKRRDGLAAAPVRAVSETRAVAALGSPIVVSAVPQPQLARDLAWRFGRIAFENATLADASHEFARYNNTRIVVDPAVADRTITGLFASNDPVGFARVAASILDLHVEVEPQEVRIVR